NINNLIFSTKTTDNQNLGNFVSSVTQLNNSFTISLDKNHKMNFKTLSKNIQINSNSIVMSNFTFYISPQDNWFTWDGNKITGLTDLGKQQSYIVLPAKTTDIANDVFANNYLVTYVDMSLTQIRRIPDGVASRTSLFYKSSLKQIILPPLLEYIGAWTFANSNLRLISTPKKTISIGDYAFYDTHNVNINQDFINKVSVIGNGVFEQVEFSDLSLDLSNVSSIGHSVFSGSWIKSVILPNTMTSIPNNLFYNTKYLQSVSIPNSVTSIGSFAFAKSNLNKIIIPEGVTAIRSYAFENTGPNLYLYLPNSITIIEKNALAGLGNSGARIYVKKNHPSNLEYLIRNAGYDKQYALWIY
ncbi:MAG: leucine-rich repeat domain-containing protein, partial [Ureaplasma sp.]|nr:leucine-rich repeat domain-containing protein [Ureaplasma sp.]